MANKSLVWQTTMGGYFSKGRFTDFEVRPGYYLSLLKFNLQVRCFSVKEAKALACSLNQRGRIQLLLFIRWHQLRLFCRQYKIPFYQWLSAHFSINS